MPSVSISGTRARNTADGEGFVLYMLSPAKRHFRCIFRNGPVHAGDRNIPPMWFQPLGASETPVTPTSPDLRAEDREEVRHIH